MSELTFGQIQDSVLDPLSWRSRRYKFLMLLLFGGIGIGYLSWLWQIRRGMGVAGISHPVGWGTYIGNFVFWIGIAHSGTLISAILFLLRAKWRTAVSRSAEAMTIFAIMTAGLFPLIHLGRFWVFYFILPYPSQRQIWPNFQSPLVLDLCAIMTYLTVSVIFFYVGLIPDLAKARDDLADKKEAGWRYRLYRILAAGWQGTHEQWLHHGRGYLFFAALATPLVVSVHSVVSWDFAAGILPGWHSTIFAPYFVAGAIHSGLAMVLTLVIPLRKLFRLEKLIKVSDFEAAALTMLVTTLIIGYSYVVEPFIAWLSGSDIERQFAWWRVTGPLGWMYPGLVICNVLLPLLFVFRRVRRSLILLFIISILVNVGMWSERLWIVIASTMHDFLPHNWGAYFPTWVEWAILTGSFSLFFFLFFGFSKLFPSVAIADVEKEKISENTSPTDIQGRYKTPLTKRGLIGVYEDPEIFVKALEKLKDHSFGGLETFTPGRTEQVERALGKKTSGIRFLTLPGALGGLVFGFALAIWTALSFQLIVGGKHPVSIIPYCVVGFEGTILLGAIANLVGLVLFARLGPLQLHPAYETDFSRDKFGLFVECDPQRAGALERIFQETGTQTVKHVGFA